MATHRTVAPSPGQVVQVRSRQYLVESLVPPPQRGEQTLVRLSCLDDDAQGTPLEVLWETEVDARIADESSWAHVGAKGFDPPRLFSAYLNTLRWNCVTATDPRLFQAPWRAGIDVKAYQLEPLRKALQLPRVNLFIADDVGLGKTVEAGLIVRELLLRQRVRRIVVCCPPSVVLQWQDEMEQRFGLAFQVFDRELVLARRRERGYGVNPWTTHTRFILSHALLRDPAYAEPLRDWLGAFSPGSLLVLDEAHNVAPASGAKYAIDSRLTQAVREIAPRFEHRLFLTATPHNGHSNSFAALLELLDPQRFCRGVPVKSAKLLQDVMVRRLKSDLREVLAQGFPERKVVQVDIDGLQPDAPELRLPRLLAEYADLRAARLEAERKSVQNAAALVTTSLQKRLLSSIEAFWRTLHVHKKAVDKASAAKPKAPPRHLPLLREAPGADDDRAALPEDQVEAEADAQMEAATEATLAAGAARERKLLDEMETIASAARGDADPRVQKLVEWIRANLLAANRWNDRRVLIFTEYTDTKRYLEQQLRRALADVGVDPRIATFHGGMGDDRREEIKQAFNSDPAKHPLRILVATDAAREGVNLQNHCADLFHFDVPWNPGRMEQRNGRIDRVLQRAPEVRCHYFFFRQRPEDRVLQALVRKTETIERELGSLSQVLESRLEKLLGQGIRTADVEGLTKAITAEEAERSDLETVKQELEEARERREDLQKQIDRLRDLLGTSKKALGIDEESFRETLSCSLEILGAPPLKPGAHETWTFPSLDQQDADSSWADALDTLRPPRPRDQKPWEWRRDNAPRPIVFRDPGNLDNAVVHLHLEHRIVQRLLGRFLAQGFVRHDLSRACLAQTQDPIPRVVILGRLSLYGEGAARLHDEVIAVAARWADSGSRKEGLKPFGSEGEATAVRLLQESLLGAQSKVPDPVQKRLLASVAPDMRDLQPHLQERANALAQRAAERLAARGESEAKAMALILDGQRKRIEETVGRYAQLRLDFDEEGRRQIDADHRHWQRRLEALRSETKEEPERIRKSYDVRATRVEPVGLVYLWPISG